MTPARTIAAALLAVAALPVGATADPSAACPAQVSTTADGWRRVAAPRFTSGQLAVITAYAVAPHSPTTMLVTNGAAVLRTRDGGCTWTGIFTLPRTPSAEFPFTAAAEIVDLVAAKQRMYALVRDGGVPRVVLSSDGGASWRTASIPAFDAHFSQFPPKLVADTSGLYAYLTVRPTGGLLVGTGESLYATSDGGETWTPRPVDLAGGGAAHARIVDIAVDPMLGTDVWVTTDNGLFRTGDGGGSWTYTPVGDGGALGSVAVAHRADQPVLVVVAAAYDGIVYVRRAGGGWTTVNTPGAVTSAAGGRNLSQVAVTTASGAYELDFEVLSWKAMHRGAPALSKLSTDDTANAAFYACACAGTQTAIWSRAPRTFEGGRNRGDDRGADNPEGGVPGSDGCAPDNSKRVDPAGFGPSEVAGPPEDITVPPGQSVKVPYRFRVQPRTLDLYFLVDSGPRSRDFICLAKQGAIWAAYDLARSRNVRVGLGQYRDYLVTGQVRIVIGDCLTNLRRDFVYRRDLRMGPLDAVFRNAVSAIGYGNTQCTGDHAGLPALLQAVTGVGQDVAPRGPSPYDIEPGQDAVFAPDAYKVILHVAGGYFSTPERVSQYPGPEFEPVIEALNEAGVKQVGINVPPRSKKKHHEGADPQPPGETGAQDLRRVAAETGTVAATPVDCGKRVREHVAVGDPLVCTYLDEGRRIADGPPMGRLMVDLMDALRDVQPMRLTVVGGDARLTPVTPATTRRLDHLRAQALDYTVTFRCAPSEAGIVKRVQLGGQVGSTVVATTTATVRCGAPPVPRPPVYVAPALPPVANVAAPAAHTVANTNLAVNTATQSQAQSQHLMQGAAMMQENQEHQLAYADVNRPPATDEELAMSALPRRMDDVPPWALAEAAALMTAGAAWYVSRRTRTAFRPARARSR